MFVSSETILVNCLTLSLTFCSKFHFGQRMKRMEAQSLRWAHNWGRPEAWTALASNFDLVRLQEMRQAPLIKVHRRIFHLLSPEHGQRPIYTRQRYLWTQVNNFHRETACDVSNHRVSNFDDDKLIHYSNLWKKLLSVSKCFVVAEKAKTRHRSLSFHCSQSEWSSTFRASRNQSWIRNKRVQHDLVDKCSQNSSIQASEFAVSNIEFHLSAARHSREFPRFSYYPPQRQIVYSPTNIGKFRYFPKHLIASYLC